MKSMFKKSYVSGVLCIAVIAAFVIGIPVAPRVASAVDACTVAPQLTINSAKQVSATVGQALTYSIDIKVTPDTSSAQEVKFSALPSGLTIKSTTGGNILSGTPTVAGAYPITFTVTNSCGTDSDSFTVTVAASTAVASATTNTANSTTVGLDNIPSTGFGNQNLFQVLFYTLSLVLVGGFAGYLFYGRKKRSPGNTNQ